MFSPKQIAELDSKLDPAHIKSRVKGGTNLSYIEGWHVIAEANRIFGFDGWDTETVDIRMTCETERNGKPYVGYLCKVRITVYADGKVIVREGIGHGSQSSNDLADAHEGAAKEAETDAMKRALKSFGNPFGLCLYDKAQAGVDKPITGAELTELAKPINKDIADAKTQADLDKILSKHEAAVSRMPEGWRVALTNKIKEKSLTINKETKNV
jgi:DNA recombination protein Rad52